MPASSFLFVVRGGENYGVERKLLGLMRTLRARGLPVDLYAIGEGGFVDNVRAIGGVGVHVDDNVPTRFTGNGLARIASFAKLMSRAAELRARLATYLNGRRYDALVFCEHGLVLAVGAAAKAARTPAYWLMPNLVSGDYPMDLNRRIYAWAFKAFNVRPIANSEATRLSLGRAGKGAAQIDLGVDPEVFARPCEPAPSPFAGAGGPILLVMARLVPEKGQLMLLRALLSRPGLAGLRLVVCGGPLDTPYARSLQQLADEAGAADRLRLAGPVSDVRPWYALADVVASVRIDPEPFGLSIVEAMMAARPVLVHALGGPAGIVVDGETGWHIQKPEVEAFADGLERMMADRDRWPAMGQAGLDRALTRYSLDAMADGFLGAATPSPETRVG